LNKIRTLIVDDSLFMRLSLTRILESDGQIEIIGEAENGAVALEKIAQLHPDVVILDLVMPVMDGMTALKRIMSETPTPVVIFSSSTYDGAQATLEALALGAVDFVTKPGSGILHGSAPVDVHAVHRELGEKVKAAYASKLSAALNLSATRDRFRAVVEEMTRSRLAPSEPEAAARRNNVKGKRLFAIAASTGGPTALQIILSELPADLNAGGVVVLHIAPGFTGPLAARMNELSSLNVIEAQDGAEILPGVVLIAPAGVHLTVKRQQEKFTVQLTPEPADALHRPSADVMFGSIANCCAEDTCAVILTGMGNDGALGIHSIHKNGGYTIAQDEATSVIYGMPRRAVELGGVDISLPIGQIAAEIARVTKK